MEPLEWGTLDTPFAKANKGSFTRIIAADCLWMRSQHENLVRTMLWFLADTSTTPEGGNEFGKDTPRVWVVAGFHTGRDPVARFFDTASDMGLRTERIYERDLNSVTEDGEEVRREWTPVRAGEGPENRRRWSVVAVLVRSS